MDYYIGVDLGGTNIKAGVIDSGWNIVHRASIPTETAGGQEHVLARMAMIAKQVEKDSGVPAGSVKAVGVGVPGPVGPAGDVVLEAPNLGWKNAPVRAAMEAELDWPVFVVNDANAAGYGEYLAGVGRDERVTDLVLLTLGTGVGSGIVIGGKLLIGPHGAGAELGHSIVVPGGHLCGCGQRGCIEQYASATAVIRDGRAAAASGKKTTLPTDPQPRDVFNAAYAGDAVAKAIIDDYYEKLGLACVNFVHAFDPQLILLGGGMAAEGPRLAEGVREAFDRLKWHVAPTYVKFRVAKLGNDAGFIGSAGMASERAKALRG